MLPILFTIPPLPGGFFLPLLVLTVLGAAVFSLRGAAQLRAADSAATGDVPASADDGSAVTFPLFVAAFVGGLLWVWSRNPIKLHSYGLFLILGFAAAVWSACREARRRGRDLNIILDLSIPLLVFSVIMCRVLYIALDPGQFDSIGEMVRLWDGGLSFHGSLVAAPLVIWFYAQRNGMSFGELADIMRRVCSWVMRWRGWVASSTAVVTARCATRTCPGLRSSTLKAVPPAN
jgi:phosphatidylglycerol:prolipoprotein diacylglycerol transferase